MKAYEAVIVIKPDVSTDQVDEIKNYIDEKIGKIIKQEQWGSKKLAYPIAKETKGIYSYYTFDADAQNIKDLNHWLGIHRNVLRHLIVKRSEV
ncbi:MAG: 30S ribosomal protein S6 [Deltaproteobacteria bacterium]|nr:30S ribosomal protein S6 [Deltaproteobacteria bacterium]